MIAWMARQLAGLQQRRGRLLFELGTRIKSGPYDSLNELLLVRGVTPELLFGKDKNRNGVIDPDEAERAIPPISVGPPI